LFVIFMLGALAAGVFFVWLGLGPGGPAQSRLELDLAQRRVRYGVEGKQTILSLDAIELVAVQPVRNDITVHVRGGSTYQKVEHEEQVVVFPGGRALWTAGMPSRAVHAIAGHLAQAIGRPVARLGGDVSAPLPGPWTHGARVAVRLPGNVPAVGFLSQATPTGAVDPRRAPNLVVLLTTGQTVRVGMSDVAPIG